MRRGHSAAVTVVVGALLALAPPGCGGDGAKQFGGVGSGGNTESGGAAGTTGGASGAGSGGETAASGGRGGSSVGSGGQAGLGSGGVLATGGRPNTGGAVATGGRPNTGGASPGRGGVSGMGGRANTGGVGTGGMGTGGSGGGGIAGSGGTGTGGNPGVNCNAIAASYDAAMPDAKVCDTTGGLLGTQCKSPVSAHLGCGSECFTFVQDPTRLNEIAAMWTANRCQAPLCPAIACQTPVGVKCPGSGLLGKGVCTDTF
jgi:hypothetical protein